MQITNFKTAGELDTAGADFIISQLKGNKSSLLCAATGSSATGIYQTLVNKKEKINTAALKFIKLDEWAGLPMDHPGSCEHYVQHYLLQPLGISFSNYISFSSKADGPVGECKKIEDELKANGPIDLCILGLGLNGHIAFNDPADALQPGIHLAKLSEASMSHPMVKDVTDKPKYGYTLGLTSILQAKTILLVVRGEHKRKIFQQF